MKTSIEPNENQAEKHSGPWTFEAARFCDGKTASDPSFWTACIFDNQGWLVARVSEATKEMAEANAERIVAAIKAQEWVKLHGLHTNECGVWVENHKKLVCDCGLAELLKNGKDGK